MTSQKRKIGDLGEKIAEKWLNNKGFSTLERNYLKKWGEIDIIAQLGGIIHFIEVKSVTCENIAQVGPPAPGGLAGKSGDEYRPEDNVHPAKIKRLHRTIQSYLLEKDIEGEWVLDLITVHLDFHKKQAKVQILENIVI